MPTTYTDQFFLLDPAVPPPVGTALNPVLLDLVDANDDGEIERPGGDTVDGSDVVAAWPGDVVTINVPGVGNITYVGTTFYLADGQRVFTPTDGQVLQAGEFVSSTYVTSQGPLEVGDLGPPCFTPGTLVDTDKGPRLIETLEVGDMIWTLDNGFQPLRWIGSRTVSGREKFAPIRFDAGTIGNEKPLVFSPNHRVLISDWRSQLYCGEEEQLVAAKHLVNGDTIRIEEADEVTYVHLLFDRHEVLRTDGALTESFFPEAVTELETREMLAEISALFPDILARARKGGTIARRMAKKHEALLLAS